MAYIVIIDEDNVHQELLPIYTEAMDVAEAYRAAGFPQARSLICTIKEAREARANAANAA